MTRPAWLDSPLMKAARRQPAERTPVWLMRQAGRYLPEYRKLRQTTPFLDLCKNSDLASEVMLKTVERLGVDAAIIFSDLLVVLEPMGTRLEFSAGEGPQLAAPIRTADQVDRLQELESIEPLGFLCSIRCERPAPDYPRRCRLSASPGRRFTLAAYLIEGGASRGLPERKDVDVQRHRRLGHDYGPAIARGYPVAKGPNRGRRAGSAVVR